MSLVFLCSLSQLLPPDEAVTYPSLISFFIHFDFGFFSGSQGQTKGGIYEIEKRRPDLDDRQIPLLQGP